MDNIRMETENLTFILPLEDIDINLLPNYFKKKKKEEAVPIWSASNLDSRHNQFFEFQVLAERVDDEEPEEIIKMMPCHICNIDIPLIYLKEHRDSAKHKICTKIADRALERIKKHLSENYEIPTKCNNNTTYYCDTCALAVKIKDKGIHEKSKEHSNSATYDTLLDTLSIIYIDKNTLENFCKLGFKIPETSNEEPEIESDLGFKIPETSNEEPGIESDLTFKTPKKSNEEPEIESDICSKIPKPSNEEPEIESDLSFQTPETSNEEPEIESDLGFKTPETSNEEPEIESDYINDKQTYSNELKLTELGVYVKDICSLYEIEHSLKVTDYNLIEIKINERRVLVPVDNFHGFYTEGETVECILCKVEIRDELPHMYEERHVNKIMAPLKDHHCIREVGNIKHCIICNKIIDCTHISSVEHNLKLRNALISETSDIKEIKYSENYCKLCDTILPIGQTADSVAHKTSGKHRMYLWQTKPKLHHHLKTTNDPNTVSCQICYLPIKDVKDHFQSKIHTKRYKALLEVNQIEKLDNTYSFCHVCDSRMLIIDELVHIRGKKHRKKLEEFRKTDKKSNLFFTNELDNGHVDTCMSEIEHLYLVSSDGIINFYLDENCDETDKETSAIFKELIDEYKSENTNLFNLKVTQGNVMLVSTNSDVVKQCLEKKNTNAITKPFTDLTKVFYLMEQTDQHGVLLCKVCQTTVPNTVHDINNHYKDSQHFQNFSKCIDKTMALLKKCDNNAEKITDRDQIDTKPDKKAPDVKAQNVGTKIPPPSKFDLKLPLFGSILQSKSNTKTKLVASNRQSTSNPDSTSQILMETNNDLIKEGLVAKDLSRPSTPKNDDTAHKNSSKIINYYLLANTQNPNELLCYACNVIVPNFEANIREHLKGAKHEKNFKAMLQKNKLTEVGNTIFFCGYCNINVAYSQIKVHISKGCHSLLVKSDINFQTAVNIPNLHTNINEIAVKIQKSPTNVNEKAMKIQKPLETNVNGTAVHIKKSQTNINETTVNIKQSQTNESEKAVKIKKSPTNVNETAGKYKKSQMNVNETAAKIQKPQKNVNEPYHFCDICKLKLTNGAQNIEIHEKGGQHLENIKQRILKLENSLTLVQAKTLNYAMELTLTGELYCKVCKLNVPNNTSCVNIHLKGGPHTKAYNYLLKCNNITKDGNTFYCHSCTVFLPLSTELKHTENMNHLVKVLENNGLLEAGDAIESASSTSSQSVSRRVRSRKNKNKN